MVKYRNMVLGRRGKSRFRAALAIAAQNAGLRIHEGPGGRSYTAVYIDEFSAENPIFPGPRLSPFEAMSGRRPLTIAERVLRRVAAAYQEAFPGKSSPYDAAAADALNWGLGIVHMTADGPKHVPIAETIVLQDDPE
jgi:hypothetical protein